MLTLTLLLTTLHNCDIIATFRVCVKVKAPINKVFKGFVRIVTTVEPLPFPAAYGTLLQPPPSPLLHSNLLTCLKVHW